MAAAAFLNCWIRKILLAVGVWRGRRIIVPKFVKIGRFIAKILRFFEFSRWPLPPAWIFEIAKFYCLLVSRGSRHICMPNFVKIGQSVAKDINIYRFSRWQSPPSWIGLWHIWTTHHEYLEVCISLQNLVMIEAVHISFIIWTFQYLMHLAQKCLFTPPKLGFWGNLDP